MRARRSRYCQITANIAPVWIAISKTLAVSPVKSSSEPARIRWPVDEIGRNSVSPSTTPMMAAFSSRIGSKAVLSRGHERRRDEAAAAHGNDAAAAA